VALVEGTEGGDMVGLGTVATTPADGWVIASPAGFLTGTNAPLDALLLLFEADASGDTVTLVAGTDVLAPQRGKGNDTIVLAASDIRLYKPEVARLVQPDGTLKATCTDAGTRCYAFTLPRQVGRGGQ
jgi:hypothetical protein